jgi:hypothetical protein
MYDIAMLRSLKLLIPLIFGKIFDTVIAIIAFFNIELQEKNLIKLFVMIRHKSIIKVQYFIDDIMLLITSLDLIEFSMSSSRFK